MDEPLTESKPKARKISIQVTEQPPPEPVAPAPTPLDQNVRKKKLRSAYIYIVIGIALVIASSFGIYTPNASGQAALAFLILGGLWLVYGTYIYLVAKE
jgi:hypothetical protein